MPTACLRTTNTVSRPVAQRLPRTITVHGLLAADLALGDRDREAARYGPWNAVCPSPEDFATVPLLWTGELQELLPGPARELLAKQRDKFDRDWADVVAAYPDLETPAADGDEASPKDRYRHAWLLVNTRTFYYVSARLRRKVRPSDTDNCMCLQPMADLFNHDDGVAGGCHVGYDGSGFSVHAERDFAPGEEVRISYGRHPGDMLLVEYGFALGAAQNRWDEVGLDDVLLPRLTRRQRDALDDAGFLGGYVLDCNGVCHRTQVAVRRLCCSVGEWRRFADGVDDGSASQAKVDGLLVEILGEFRDKAEKMIEQVEGMTELGKPEQRAVLAQRWGQIKELLTSNIAKLRSRDDS